MNKRLTKTRDLLMAKLANLQNKMKAGVSDELKATLDIAIAELESAIAELEASENDATAEEIASLFTKASEAFISSGKATEQEVASLKNTMEAQISKLQAQIQKGNGAKKGYKAQLHLSKTRTKDANSFVPFHAGVDVTDWTPDADVEIVGAFHPLIGVVSGFNVGTTGKPSLKVRKLTTTGTAMVVANHAPKPLIEIVGSQNIVNAETIAGIVEGIADEDLEDNSELETEIVNEALITLAQAENTSAIALLEACGNDFEGTAFGTVAYADEKTAIIAIIDEVKQKLGNRPSPIAFAMNSSQWAKLKDLRNANGTPIPIETLLGDIQAIEDNSITGDNFYCWAKSFVNFKVYKSAKDEWYKGVKTVVAANAITAVYSEWRTDESSLRVRERALMYASDTSVILKGSLADVVALITEEVVVAP